MNDIILSYMLLRQAPKDSPYRKRTASNLQQTLMVMRAEDIWRWICVVLLQQANITNSDELPRQAYLRGLFIERLAKRSDLRLDSQNGFMLGVFSLLDQVMGVPIEELLDGFEMDPALRAALLVKDELFDAEENNPCVLFLRYVLIYELANERLELPDIQVRMNDNEIYNLHMTCIADTDAAFEQAKGSP